MKTNNKDLVLSYISVAARYDFNIHEQRIFLKLVELCQNQLNGQALDKNFQINKTLFGDYIVTMPTSAFLKDEHDENHSRVKVALTRLRNKTIEYEDDKIWKLIGIIEKPKFDKTGYVSFEVQPEIYEVILDFSKGWRRIELGRAMSFDSVYAVRFYELFSGKSETITYSYENLKMLFKVENKYNCVTDFVRRVIEPAKRELDEKAPFSFNYKPVLNGRKIVAFKFTPYIIPQNRDPEVEHQQLNRENKDSWIKRYDLSEEIVIYLENEFLFSMTEIKNNMETLKTANKMFDLLRFLSKKREKYQTEHKGKGWIINAIKKEISTLKNS